MWAEFFVHTKSQEQGCRQSREEEQLTGLNARTNTPGAIGLNRFFTLTFALFFFFLSPTFEPSLFYCNLSCCGKLISSDEPSHLSLPSKRHRPTPPDRLAFRGHSTNSISTDSDKLCRGLDIYTAEPRQNQKLILFHSAENHLLRKACASDVKRSASYVYP